MKRHKQKNKAQAKRKRPDPASVETPADEPSRRAFLRKSGNIAVATLVVGGGSWLLVDEVRAKIHESDLTRIGNGVLSVVQIHDPQCSKCVALQREARDAMCALETDRLQFLVADISSEEGRKLARDNHVGHVTLLFFDKNGRRRGVIVGNTTSEFLAEEFRRHIRRFGDR